MKVWQHFKTITLHKCKVMKGCFAIGLYKQGLLHDLSKYSPTEFLPGCKYFQGYMSPNNAERYDKGYSSAWLHHKGRNKHHLEYWIDYGVGERGGEGRAMCGMKMPVKYVMEMFIDRVSASKIYKKEEYTDKCPWDYYVGGLDVYIIHPDTQALLEYVLTMLYKRGEKETFAYVKNVILKGKVPYEREQLEILKNAL